VVVEGLAPGDEGQAGEGLGLEFQGEVEVLDDGVDAKGDTADGPEDEHGAGETVCVFAAVVVPYLRDDLDTPTYCADGLWGMLVQWRRWVSDVSLRLVCSQPKSDVSY
jgi:hypothetical protein